MTKTNPYSGIFSPIKGDVAGHLSIAGSRSFVEIVGQGPLEDDEREFVDICGVLSDGRKASLLQCICSDASEFFLGNENIRFKRKYFPHYVVVGKEFVQSGHEDVHSISYSFLGINKIIDSGKDFGIIHSTNEQLQNIIENERNSLGDVFRHKYSGALEVDNEIGVRPIILYFTGLFERFGLYTSLGHISLRNVTSYGPGSASGISIKNSVVVRIEFALPKNVEGAVSAIRNVHQLFELCIGSRQEIEYIDIMLSKSDGRAVSEYPDPLRLYWSLGNDRIKIEPEGSPRSGVLLSERRTDEFKEVVAAWVNSLGTMHTPRWRLSESMASSYSGQRIVGAANMFDLLPASHVPKAVEISEEEKQAVERTKKIFSPLKDGFARQSILNALGRIGQPSLREKVLYRANIVTGAAQGEFRGIDLPCTHAVRCRNHFVHGSAGAFDYQGNFAEFAFLVDTLEFVFAVSDLIELGWDFRQWLSDGPAWGHPFGSYVANFPANLASLRAITA